MPTFTNTSNTHGNTTFLSILISSSNQKISLNQKVFYMEPHDIIFCRENIKWTSEDPLYCINIHEEAFDELFYTQVADCRILFDFLHTTSTHDEYLYFRCANDQDTLHILTMVQSELKKKDSYHEKMMKVIMTALFTSLDRSHHETLQLADSTMISDHIFGKILKYMGDHYTTCSIQKIAEVYGYHPDYLSSYFKRITGVTFRQKLLSIRLEKALELLLTTDYTVEQIALKVGFQDKSWFQKKFKEHYRQTPAVYRKKHRR